MDQIIMLSPLAWRNLWRNPRRTFVTLAVVAVGLYSVLVLDSLLEAWAQSSRSASLSLLIGDGQIHANGYLDDPTIAHRMPEANGALQEACRDPDLDVWVARVRVPAVIRSEYKTLPITFLGVQPKGEWRISRLPHQMIEGRYLEAKDDMGIVLGQHLAHRLKTRVGKRVVMMAQSKDGSLAERAYQVVGLFGGNQNAEDAYAFTGIQTAQAMLGIQTEISEISFLVREPEALDGLVQRIRTRVPELDVAAWRDLAPMVEALDVIMHSMTFVWLFVMCAFMCIGIVNTQLMAVFERVREFGLLQAIGMRAGLILVQVLLESVILIGLGVILSLVTACATVLFFKDGVNLGFMAQGAEYLGVEHVLYPKIAFAQYLGLSSIVFVIGVLITLWPAWRASRSNPVEAMRHA